jgi:lipopolysaccharide/colanic/teichoic acid biosynthesis glycosyltransferase
MPREYRLSSYSRAQLSRSSDDCVEHFSSPNGEAAYAVAAPWAVRVKRGLDLTLAIVLAPFVALLILLICLLVMLECGNPIYRHLRLGRGGRTFYCYKIRTMALDADAQLKALLESNHLARQEWFEQFKLKTDPRITRLGGFLRKASLDELPQLWNVLKGEMSLIGPRPITPGELQRYGEHAAAYLACYPGISGLWQISGRNDTSYEKRVLMDERYARRWTFTLDLWILLQTLPAVLKAGGSY